MSEHEQDPTIATDSVVESATNAGDTTIAEDSAPGAGGGAPQVPQQNMHFIEETGRWTYTDADGISFEYDENLKAWFPMVRFPSKAKAQARVEGLELVKTAIVLKILCHLFSFDSSTSN